VRALAVKKRKQQNVASNTYIECRRTAKIIDCDWDRCLPCYGGTEMIIVVVCVDREGGGGLGIGVARCGGP